MNNRLRFKEFCETEKEIPIFLTYGWLNTVAPSNWDVVLEESAGEIKAFLPYTIQKRFGFTLIELPELTPWGGIWIKYPQGQKYVNRLGYEKDVFNSLIKKLPKFDSLIQKFTPEISNWLPFYWNGYFQSTAYTYVIKDLENHENIFSQFTDSLRQKIRKAEKLIDIQSSPKIETLYTLNLKSYTARKIKLNFDETYLKKIYSYCLENNCGELLIAKDKLGNIHATSLFVWDKKSVYYLRGASDPAFKGSGAMGLLLWHAIKKYSPIVKEFNFEGSMNEEIERFFRGFGATQVPYLVIKKVNSKLLKLKHFISEFK